MLSDKLMDKVYERLSSLDRELISDIFDSPSGSEWRANLIGELRMLTKVTTILANYNEEEL